MSDSAENDARCGSFGCTLPAGHNMGRADVPENHLVDQWVDGWDVRPLIEARIRRAQADALREAAAATLSMTYPASADPDVWGAWLLERAEAIEASVILPASTEETP